MRIFSKEIIDGAIEKIKPTLPNLSQLNPLELHVLAFGTLLLSDRYYVSYSAKSISDALVNRDPHNVIAGTAIHYFNALHTGNNSGGLTPFDNQPASLHVGTLRFNNPDGTFNDDAWDDLIRYHIAKNGSNIPCISQSELLAHLEEKTKTLPDESDTGRHGNFLQKSIQRTAGKAAWREVFKILACGWQTTEEDPSVLEPLAQLDLIKLFFGNSIIGLKLATEFGLPVSAPKISSFNHQQSFMARPVMVAANASSVEATENDAETSSPVRKERRL